MWNLDFLRDEELKQAMQEIEELSKEEKYALGVLVERQKGRH